MEGRGTHIEEAVLARCALAWLLDAALRLDNAGKLACLRLQLFFGKEEECVCVFSESHRRACRAHMTRIRAYMLPIITSSGLFGRS
jgi:hypothetical protein